MTEAEHVKVVRGLLADAVRAPLVEAGARFAAVRDAIDRAASDGVAKSLFPQDLGLPTIATRAHGQCAIGDALSRWKRDGWLSS